MKVTHIGGLAGINRLTVIKGGQSIVDIDLNIVDEFDKKDRLIVHKIFVNEAASEIEFMMIHEGVLHRPYTSIEGGVLYVRESNLEDNKEEDKKKSDN